MELRSFPATENLGELEDKPGPAPDVYLSWQLKLAGPSVIVIGSHSLAGENKSLLIQRHNVPYSVTGPMGP